MNSAKIVRFLLANHIVTPEEIVDTGIALVSDVRDRFTIQSLRVGNRSRLVVKQAVSEDGLAGLQREITNVRYLASRAETRGILPHYYASDQERGLLAIEVVGAGAAVTDQGNSPIFASHVAPLIGKTLGSLHRHTRGQRTAEMSDEIPWTLGVLELGAPWRPPSFDLVLSRTNDQFLLRSGLAAARTMWNADCLVHCDLKWDHCLVEKMGNKTERIHFIDWELAIFGDPAWDVASIIHEYLMSSYPLGATHPGTHRQNNLASHFASARNSIGPFMKHYFAEAKIGAKPANDRFIERSVLFLGARCLQTSFELAIIQQLSGAEFTLHLAEAVFRNTAEVARELRAIAHSA